jgi:hypothetical protein
MESFIKATESLQDATGTALMMTSDQNMLRKRRVVQGTGLKIKEIRYEACTTLLAGLCQKKVDGPTAP